MSRPVPAFVLALVSVILCPVLLIIELSGLFFAGMVAYEPSNSLLAKALVIAAVGAIALLSLAIPIIALMMGNRARSVARSTQAGSTGLATSGVVISAIVTVGVLGTQGYYLLMVFGNCSLDGC